MASNLGWGRVVGTTDIGDGGMGSWEVHGKHKCSPRGLIGWSHWVKLQMLVSRKPFRGLGWTFNNLCSPKRAQLIPIENTAREHSQ